ncbi:MAG: class I SAM-dependent methyltransferase [Pseudomonadota bacterium]
MQTRLCLNCGLVFNNPIPDEAALKRFYSEDYRRDYKNTEVPKLRHHVRYAKRVTAQIAANPGIYRKAHRILDIGSGSGEALALFSKLGFEAEGVEPTRAYAEYVTQTFGCPVFCGSIDDFSVEEPFDFVRLHHVLEHMRDPVEKLLLISRLMSDTAILHIEVPDFRGYCRSKSPGNVFHYGHIYNFCEETLLMTAARAGFREVARHQPTSIYFAKAEPFETSPDPEAAKALQDLYGEHRAGAFDKGRQSSGVRLFGRVRRVLKEQVEIGRLGSPARIIEHFADQIAPVLR